MYVNVYFYKMKAMIFAAGLGTRLKPFTENAPKALARVGDKTLLERAVNYLARYNIRDIIINVHHFADMIESALYANNNFGCNITISDERDEVLETGGGLKKASWYFEGERDFVVMNVDVLTNLDLSKLVGAHRQNKSVGTLAVMKRESSRQLLFDENMILCGWENSGTGALKIARPLHTHQPYAFSGIQVLSPGIWAGVSFSGKFSLIDLYLQVAATNIINGYDHTGDIFIDVGKPESIAKASTLFT